MGDKKENNKKKCKNCGAEIESFDYCRECSKKISNELAITDKYPNDIYRTINFYILKLVEYFKYHDKVVLSFIFKYSHIANEVIDQTKHMGYFINKRYSVTDKSRKPPYKTLEFIKAPLELLPPIRGLKKDREREGKFYD